MNANVVYVDAGEANIQAGSSPPATAVTRSTDAGKTWTASGNRKGRWNETRHPANPDIAVAAVLGSDFGPNPERGVYRTKDGGKTWGRFLRKER